MRIGPPRSLFGQIALVHVLTALVLALTLPVAIGRVLRHTAQGYQQGLLVRQAGLLEARLHAEGGRWRLAPDPVQDGLYAAGQAGRAFRVVAPDGRTLLASAQARPAPEPRRAQPAFFTTGALRGLSRPIDVDGRRAWLVVTQNTTDPEVVIDDVVRAFLARFVWLLLPLLALLPIANLALIRRSTARIEAVSARAAAIGPQRLDLRLPARELPREVEPLATATNIALDRLEAGFRSQSEFVANVAHELRTPLASLRLRLDEVADPALAAAMRATLDRAAHVVSQLFDLASLERLSVGEGESFDLVRVASEAVAEAAPAIYAGGRTIGLAGLERPLAVQGHAPLIGLALANLIDNAARHTPPGSRIEVHVSADGTLAVEDDGPGIAPAGLARVTQRFWRGDHSRSDSAGIGLSIVERILAAHRSTLVVANRAGGGARFAFALVRSA